MQHLNQIWDNQWEQMQIQDYQWEHMIFFVGKYAVTGSSFVTYAVIVFSVGTEAVTNSVTDEDACFFSKSFTWFLIVFNLSTEEKFHTC